MVTTIDTGIDIPTDIYINDYDGGDDQPDYNMLSVFRYQAPTKKSEKQFNAIWSKRGLRPPSCGFVGNFSILYSDDPAGPDKVSWGPHDRIIDTFRSPEYWFDFHDFFGEVVTTEFEGRHYLLIRPPSNAAVFDEACEFYKPIDGFHGDGMKNLRKAIYRAQRTFSSHSLEEITQEKIIESVMISFREKLDDFAIEADFENRYDTLATAYEIFAKELRLDMGLQSDVEALPKYDLRRVYKEALGLDLHKPGRRVE